MGHTRLGVIPKSKKWIAVVGQIVGVAGSGQYSIVKAPINVEKIAQQTLEAAQAGITASINDAGLLYTFFTLTQITLAARKDDWQEGLANLGLRLSEDSSLDELTVEMQGAIDDFLFANNYVTDISEMAQKAAGEALTVLARPKSSTLFGSGLSEVKDAIRDLSTKQGFADLGQKFFGLYMARFLNFYLSRISASEINGAVFSHIGDISEFNEALRQHCEQSARIVRDFCGEWYSKTEYLEGINLENTAKFIAVALKKLRAEMKQQEVDS